LAAAALACAAALAEAEVSVTHRARALVPGELVVLVVRADAPLATVSGQAFGRAVSFYQGRGSSEWEGLVGIDLDTAPGPYDVTIEATPAGSTGRLSYAGTLTVEPKAFPTRRLTVDEGYVNPPKTVAARIAREAKAVSDILAETTPTRYWAGRFVAPVPGAATSSFGRRSVLNGQPRSPHSGTDFQATTGTTVRAPNAGTIVLAADQYFSGNTVIIDHGFGLYSFLAHLSRIDVQPGDVVARGEPIGLSGSTGRVTGPHLHWTVRLGGARVDPLSLLALMGAEQ
jgi:murein DD-endopeptidase MepM/ murein hydrolase activator NlpD